MGSNPGEPKPSVSLFVMADSPGLVVMGDDSCLRGCGFESQRRILDGHFFALICCKNCIICLKRPKINKKRPRLAKFIDKIEQQFPFKLSDRSE